MNRLSLALGPQAGWRRPADVAAFAHVGRAMGGRSGRHAPSLRPRPRAAASPPLAGPQI